MAGREPAASTNRSARISSPPTLEHLRPGKPRLAEEHIDAVGPPVRYGPLMQRVDPAEHPVADRRPARSAPIARRPRTGPRAALPGRHQRYRPASSTVCTPVDAGAREPAALPR